MQSAAALVDLGAVDAARNDGLTVLMMAILGRQPSKDLEADELKRTRIVDRLLEKVDSKTIGGLAFVEPKCIECSPKRKANGDMVTNNPSDQVYVLGRNTKEGWNELRELLVHGGAEWVTQSAARCRRGHRCEALDSTSNRRPRCDSCSRVLDDDPLFWTCRICDFDLCHNCSEVCPLVKLSRQNQKEHAMWWTAPSVKANYTVLNVQGHSEMTTLAGWSVLTFAAAAGRFDIVKKLSAAMGAGHDHFDENMMTPLHWAAYAGHAMVIENLANAASATVIDKLGRAPLALAPIKMLESAGMPMDMLCSKQIKCTMTHRDPNQRDGSGGTNQVIMLHREEIRTTQHFRYRSAIAHGPVHALAWGLDGISQWCFYRVTTTGRPAADYSNILAVNDADTLWPPRSGWRLAGADNPRAQVILVPSFEEHPQPMVNAGRTLYQHLAPSVGRAQLLNVDRKFADRDGYAVVSDKTNWITQARVPNPELKKNDKSLLKIIHDFR